MLISGSEKRICLRKSDEKLGFSVRVSKIRNTVSVSVIHRVTMTQYRSICMPASFRHHLVGETTRNVFTVRLPKCALSVN